MKSTSVLVLLALLLVPSAAGAASAVRQAEDFTSYLNLAYYPIRSNLGMLEGLDAPGEWTQYIMPTLPFGTYKVTLRCWGNEIPYHLQLATFPVQGEEPQTINFAFTGLGTSVCG